MSYTRPDPKPADALRHGRAKDVRDAAFRISQPQRVQKDNGEVEDFAGTWPTNFTKGLPHDVNGIVDGEDFKTFFEAINAPDRQFDVELGPVAGTSGNGVTQFLTSAPGGKNWKVRGWESPVAGHTYDLEGPDAGAVAMAPAPRLDSDELAAEMAEVYAMALLRDTPFEDIAAGTGKTGSVLKALNELEWFKPGNGKSYDDALEPSSRKRRDGRMLSTTGLTEQTLFRGSSPGCQDGPYISQFLLQGNGSRDLDEDGNAALLSTTRGGSGAKTFSMIRDVNGVVRQAKPEHGYILYGAQRIDQRVHAQKYGTDYLQHWSAWLDAQNGADMGGIQDYESDDHALRFIAHPRDLASFVHVDALYQAYLNACLMLLDSRARTDPGLPENNESGTRTPFATFGGPHILTLVTEVATRALKAVRRQKFNIHCRARPEALAAVATLTRNGHGVLDAAQGAADTFLSKLQNANADGFSVLDTIAEINKGIGATLPAASGSEAHTLPSCEAGNLLLPMAFPEGSPMHPAYGAGHATVAGACVTILKAFFQMTEKDGTPITLARTGFVGPTADDDDFPIEDVFVSRDSGRTLEPHGTVGVSDLTLAGELNKLAANISIGRNMAGVHYYSDYFDSLRMGERIAVGILEEQLYTWGEPVFMTFPDFDGDLVKIAIDNKGKTSFGVDGDETMRDAWYARHLPPQT